MDRQTTQTNRSDGKTEDLNEKKLSQLAHQLDLSTTDPAKLRRDLIRAFVDHELLEDGEKLIAKQIADDSLWQTEHQDQLRLKAIQSASH